MENVDMICLQETKKEVIEKAMCQTLWGDAEVCWEMQSAVNTAGGILCLWSENSFKLHRSVIGNGFILLNTHIHRSREKYKNMTLFSIFSHQIKKTRNKYYPYSLQKQLTCFNVYQREGCCN